MPHPKGCEVQAAGPLGAAIVRDASTRGEGIRDWAARVGVPWRSVYDWIAGRATPRLTTPTGQALVAALRGIGKILVVSKPKHDRTSR